MLRAAAWTFGLFAVGGGVAHLFPGPLTEPLVLLVLGSTLFLVSGRPQATGRPEEPGRASEAAATSRAAR